MSMSHKFNLFLVSLYIGTGALAASVFFVFWYFFNPVMI